VKDYDYPVYATQGGGLATFRGRDTLIFVEAPPAGMGLDVGDEVPHEWDYQPANELARYESDPGGLAAYDYLLEMDTDELERNASGQTQDD
jgi:hypothetical protein